MIIICSDSGNRFAFCFEIDKGHFVRESTDKNGLKMLEFDCSGNTHFVAFKDEKYLEDAFFGAVTGCKSEIHLVGVSAYCDTSDMVFDDIEIETGPIIRSNKDIYN